MLNYNLGVTVRAPKDSVIKQGSIYLIADTIKDEYLIADVVYPDKDGEFKKGDVIAFVGTGVEYNDVLIIQKHQILFQDAG